MVTIPQIPQNVFYIIVAALAVIGMIFVILQLRRVKVSKNNVAFLTKQAELRKIELVDRDLESKNMNNDLVLNKKNLSQLKENTSDVMIKAEYINNEINERVNHLESTTEYMKLQNLFNDIENKEKELDKKIEFMGKNKL